MSRRLLVILAAALLAASCSSADTLATVNGVAITKDDLVALNPAYEDPLGALTGDDLRQNVISLIVLEASMQAAQEDYGLTIDDATIAERIANPPERYAILLAPTGDGTDTIRRRAIASLVLDAVAPDLVVEDYGGWSAVLDSSPEIVSKACVRHINVATEEEAADILDRLQAGEDFSALVAEVSLDQSSEDGRLIGPDGQCLTWYSSYAPELAALAATAELNTPAGPVALGSGYSVILVEERLMPASKTELAANPMTYLDLNVASSHYVTWASDEVRVADVEISSALGTWSPEALAILPPNE